jgi:hypothetical protein
MSGAGDSNGPDVSAKEFPRATGSANVGLGARAPVEQQSVTDGLIKLDDESRPRVARACGATLPVNPLARAGYMWTVGVGESMRGGPATLRPFAG